MIKKCVQFCKQFAPFCYDLTRIYLGIGLLVKGAHFMTHPNFVKIYFNLTQYENVPSYVIYYIALAHLFGGALLAIGFLTRLAAFVQFPILIGAVFIIHFQEGFFSPAQTLEFASLVFFMLLVYMVYGSGPLSVDKLVYKKNSAS